MADEVKVLKKGDTVPFDGVLFSKQLEKEIREEVELNKLRIEKLTKLNELSEREIVVLTKRLEVTQKISLELADREVRKEDKEFLKNTLYFITGALVTGLIAHGVNR
jgi:hypothetical protein